jgi:hypothetical protein
MPTRKPSPDKVTTSLGRSQKPAKAAAKSLAGKAPLGSLPAKERRSAASSLPDFIPFATCLLVDRPPNGPDWVHEIKLDGWRIQMRVEERYQIDESVQISDLDEGDRVTITVENDDPYDLITDID